MIATVNHTRLFGVEIECYGLTDRNTLVNVLCNNGFNATSMGYNDNGVNALDIGVKTDGSLHSPQTDFRRYGHELTFKAHYKTVHLREIKRLCDLLGKLGMAVNKSTGLHVHIDISDYNIAQLKSLYNLVYKYENIIGGMIPLSRLRSTFTVMRNDGERKLIDRVRSFQGLERILNGSRYYGFNLNSYFKNARKTIEFRYHSGTVDYDKLVYWVLMCLRLVDHAKTRNCNSKNKLTSTRENLRNYLLAVGLKPNNKIYQTVDAELCECRTYLVKRWHKFNIERQEILQVRRAERTRRRAEREQQGQEILETL